MRRFLAFKSQSLTGPAPVLLAISIFAYAAILYWPRSDTVVRMCGGKGLNLIEFVDRSGFLPPFWSMKDLTLDWVLMCIAMMSLLISQSLAYIWRSVENRRRLFAVFSFYFSYMLVWCISGLLLVPFTIWIVAQIGQKSSFIFVLITAIIWSASPAAQLARNRSHAWIRLSGFGIGAQFDCSKFGMRAGVYCVLVCWPWMIVPSVSLGAHFTVMIATGLYLFADRITPPSSPRWRLPPAIQTLIGSHALKQRSKNIKLSVSVGLNK